MHFILSLVGFTLAVSRPLLAYHIFHSRDHHVRSVIDKCCSENSNEAIQCYEILRCVLNKVTSDVPARWSAGASILAFLPTIVGLMSNSMNEICRIAEDSVFLAAALSLSSVTTFTTRFSDITARTGDILLERRTRQIESWNDAWSSLYRLIYQKRRKNLSKWWPQPDFLAAVLGVLLLALSGTVWYEVYVISWQGIVTFACRIKIHVGLWVGLNQLFALLSIGTRRLLFDTRKIHLELGPDTIRPSLVRLLEPLTRRAAPSQKSPRSNDRTHFCIVLRSLRSGPLSLFLRNFLATTIYALYAFGTVVLASMTLIPASDAVRAMVVMTASAGFGRLVGYWALSPSRSGSQTIVVDIPAESMDGFTSFILGKANEPVPRSQGRWVAGDRRRDSRLGYQWELQSSPD